MSDILSKIVPVDFPNDQFFKEETVKNQIYLHHTVSGGSAKGDIDYWLSNPSRVSTAIVIDRNGTPYQCFSTRYWGYHLGLEGKLFSEYLLSYRPLDKTSIGVEIDSWGALIKHTDKKYYPIKWDKDLKKEVPYLAAGPIDDNKVIEYMGQGHRNFHAFEKYTNLQIQTLKELLLLWKDKWNIPLKYNDDIWNISKRALKGEPGVYNHVCVNKGKSDCHPQIELIQMLQSL
jgi:N-acetyl-anhydromuramyl-L-alanine amidase AmpD